MLAPRCSAVLICLLAATILVSANLVFASNVKGITEHHGFGRITAGAHLVGKKDAYLC